ncbi:hypothetical protein D9619_008951 [Psilocybe cf. subviscida]|uniref:Uncharacterized protein n=1 Tax=Psilocybe cf. subviscida TaxID=2480587 RepID=A0A8H5FA64_9AGAR|nr:hypothetical protein D9619_008951 [Psilocybe cf. subviscida]
MTSKTLSTSTLSLKFMQNAHRAKQLKEIELDRAEVVDDGKWEVSQAIRESWGIPSGNQTNSQDIHEASYLPFLFSDSRPGTSVSKDDNSDAVVKKPSGRRIFNKRGEEVSLAATPQPPTANEAPPINPKVHNRPVSITSSGKSGHLQGFDELDGVNTANTVKATRVQKSSKSARDAIFENGRVGADLRASRGNTANATNTPPSTSTFMKPAGIDEPANIQGISSSRKSVSEQVLDGSRQKKAKRPREQPTGEGGEVNKTKKKKKKTSVA